MRYIRGFFMSLGNFSVIPCPYRPWDEKARGLMLVFLPLVGLLMGFLWCLLFWLMAYLPIPLQLKAAFLAIYPFFITGFIHLDGFMDTQDALLSGRPLADKLRILKDPNCGAFSVISLVILFLLQFAAMWALVEEFFGPEALWKNSGYFMTFMLIPFFSRSGSALAIFTLKPLGHSQYKEGGDRTGKKAHVTAVVLMDLIFLSLFCLTTWLQGSFEYKALLVLLLVMGIYGVAIGHARRQLDGVSGDLAGYALTISETGAIIAMAILMM